jgi:hypothetical protein
MAKKKIEKTVLTDWEWTLVWSSMRYFMGRQTIASAMWPSDLIKNYDKYLTQGQRDMIAKELKCYFEEYQAFGNPNIDSEHWERLMHYMDKNNRYLVQAKYTENDQTVEEATICFKYKDVYCSIEKYARAPYHNWYVNPDFITNVREIITDEQLRTN